MAVAMKSLSLTHKSLRFLRPLLCPTSLLSVKLLSTTSTPYPLQYDMIVSRPAQCPLARRPARRSRIIHPAAAEGTAADSPKPEKPDVELGFDDWVDRKLSSERRPESPSSAMDKSKRKYYNKRMRRMYGSDSEDEARRERGNEGFVELKPEVVEFNRLHKREEELYFYDTFAYPWEKDKHYKMVYQLEKKYFPEHSLDKAFLEPGQSASSSVLGSGSGSVPRKDDAKKGGAGKVENDKGLVFFEEKEGKGDLVEKKVEEFFKCLKKVPSENGEGEEPYLLTRSTELPPRWDGPHGTVVLINKPKGELALA